MGTLMTEEQFARMMSYTFIFDLEYIGTPNVLKECYIWEIGAIHYMSGDEFTITIDPGIRPLPPPMTDEFIQVTDELLQQRMACDFKSAWTQFTRWVYSKVPLHSNIIMVAHNNFKSDKIMLEVESRRYNIHLPYSWYFFDSLLYCRKAIPKQNSYTLKDLHFNMFGKAIPNNHSALPDARALARILYIKKGLFGPIYPSYCTSLQVVKWLGPSCEKVLFDNDIRSLEKLITSILTAYSRHNLANGHVPVTHFIKTFITHICGIGVGNSDSIAESIVTQWLIHI
jgi:DNA polymerase III epsilon subunit-like protein